MLASKQASKFHIISYPTFLSVSISSSKCIPLSIYSSMNRYVKIYFELRKFSGTERESTKPLDETTLQQLEVNGIITSFSSFKYSNGVLHCYGYYPMNR